MVTAEERYRIAETIDSILHSCVLVSDEQVEALFGAIDIVSPEFAADQTAKLNAALNSPEIIAAVEEAMNTDAAKAFLPERKNQKGFVDLIGITRDFLSSFHIPVKNISEYLCREFQLGMNDPNPVAEIIIRSGKPNLPENLRAFWPAFVYGYFVGHNDFEEDEEIFTEEQE